MADHPDVAKLKDEIAQETEVPAILDAVGRRLGASLNAKAVFGAPVQRDEVTVIPVARSVWGYGAGGGSSSAKAESGGGGGGGGMATPVGYIEVTDGGATYKRIDDPIRRAAAGALTALATAGVILARTRKR